MPLRHVTEHLMGACLDMKKIRNGGNVTCPFISEFTIGLRPSHTTPQFKQTSMNPNIHFLMKFENTSKQSTKIQQWQAKDQRRMTLNCRE